MRVDHYHKTRKLLRTLHVAYKLQQLTETRDSYKAEANAIAGSLAATTTIYKSDTTVVNALGKNHLRYILTRLKIILLTLFILCF